MRIEPVFVFDLDGTLVDSVFEHVLAWKEVLDAEGIDLSVWRIHRKIDMSGGLLANQLLRETGVEITAGLVEQLRQRHDAAYQLRASAVRLLPGARELLSWLSNNEVPWAIATSGRKESAAPALEALGIDPDQTRRDLRSGQTCQARSGLIHRRRRTVGRADPIRCRGG